MYFCRAVWKAFISYSRRQMYLSIGPRFEEIILKHELSVWTLKLYFSGSRVFSYSSKCFTLFIQSHPQKMLKNYKSESVTPYFFVGDPKENFLSVILHFKCGLFLFCDKGSTLLLCRHHTLLIPARPHRDLQPRNSSETRLVISLWCG